ncbi:MAG: hypothetical protein MJZ67_00660 [Bacteroidales bacterium]|nr:hypothetical protein [Bacteroidales bacterium]
MKNRFSLTMLALALLGTSMVACQKDKDEQMGLSSFKAVIDQSGKTHLYGDGYLGVAWDANDQVLISNGTPNTAAAGNRPNNTCAYKVNSISDNVATFQAINDPRGDQNNIKGDAYALYPATSALVNEDGSLSVNIPKLQTYVENSMKGSPMYAEYHRSGNDNSNFGNNDAPTLRFKNLCSQLRLNLQGNYTIRYIEVRCSDANMYLSGNFNISRVQEGPESNRVDVWEARTEPMADPTKGMSKYISLDCGRNGVDISSATDFNIFLPVGNYNIAIALTDINGRRTKLNSTSAINFTRDHVKKLTTSVTFQNEAGAEIPHSAGIFAINATDHVYLSPTNLMNTAGPDRYYDEAWCFSQHPYDLVGTYTDHQTVWNRFSWSTTDANDDFGMKVNVHTDQSQADEEFLDWGVNEQTSHDGQVRYPANYGFTLSADEWRYLLGLDGTSRVAQHMEPESRCYGYAYILPEEGYQFYAFGRLWSRNDFKPEGSTTIPIVHDLHPNGNDIVTSELGLYDCRVRIDNNWYSGIPCLVIYPDNMPKSKQLQSWEYYCNNLSYAISDDRYRELKDYGCCFLPLLGQGQGAADNTTAQQVGFGGFYWTSSSANNNQAYYVHLVHNNTHISASIASNTRGNGNAVRLASHAPADSRHNTTSKRSR